MFWVLTPEARCDHDYSAFSIDRKDHPDDRIRTDAGSDALEGTVRQLFYSLEDAREGSAEYKMIVRQLTGLREGSEIGCLIFEEFSMRGYEIP